MEKQAMTPQQKLHTLETAIRKALPRLMELSEGCNVITKNKNRGIIVDVGYGLGLDDILDYGVLLPEDIEGKKVEYLTLSDFEILGHDILLNDVLEWLSYERKNELYTYSLVDLYNNILKVCLVTQISDVEHYAYEEIWEKIEIDLTKPRLADQSEELWNFLYNLIKE